MATLAKTDLLDAVAAKMDISSGDYSSAQESEIQEWALDCLRWLLPLAPEYSVESYLTSSGTQATPYAIPATVLKIVRVKDFVDDDLCKYIEPHKFTYVKNAYANGTNSFGKGFRIWSDIMGSIEVFRTANNIDVDYIDAPAWVGTDLTTPEGWQGLVGSYCSVQAKMKDEEVQLAKGHWEMFMQELSRFRGFEDIAKSVGG